MPEAIRLPPLRALVVTPKGFVGGAEKWLLAVLAGTDRLDARVICLDEGPVVHELHHIGVPAVVRRTGPGLRDMSGLVAWLNRQLRADAPDVVLANGIKSAAAVVPVARAMGIPVVWVRHDPSYERTIARLMGPLATREITVAPSVERNSRDPVYVPPPVLAEPLPRSRALAELRRRGVPDDGLLRVGMFCRLAPYKGIDTAIMALKSAAQWRLVVAGIEDPGQGPGELKRLQNLATEYGVTNRVSWLGNVPDAGGLATGLDGMAILTRAGVTGYPEAEGFGMNLLEAYAGGVPIVGDPRTVPPLRMPEFTEGAILLDATDPDEVAESLVRLADPETRTLLCAEAQEIGAGLPRAAEVAARVVDVLADAAHRPGAGLPAGPAMTVVATVLNEGQAADVLVDDVLEQVGSEDEFVVVDGGSTDDTISRLRVQATGDHRLVVLETGGAGISEGRNLGVSVARNEWIACTDVGCRPSPTWLAGLRAGAAAGAADLVTGVYEASLGDGKVWEAALAHVAYPSPRELTRATPLVGLYGRLFGRVFDPTLPTGRSVAFTKHAWRAAGGFPEELATAEDVTFGKRIVESGGKATLAADAVVVWAQRETLRGNLRMFYRYGVGDGQSGDRRLIGRTLGRAVAYLAGPALLACARTRPVAVAGAALYWSLPVKRALHGPTPLRAAAAVPFLAAARDLSKVAGCVAGLIGSNP